MNFIKSGGSIINSTLSGDWRFINKSGALLVPVGSEIEVQYAKENSISTIERVRAKDVKIGSIYKSLTNARSGKGSSIVYLGKLYKIEVPDASDITSIKVSSKKYHVTLESYFYNDGLSKITPRLNASSTFPTMYTGFTVSEDANLTTIKDCEDLISFKGQTQRDNEKVNLRTEFSIQSRKPSTYWGRYSPPSIKTNSHRVLDVIGGYSLDKEYLQSICDSILEDHSNGVLPEANPSGWRDTIYTKTIPLNKVSTLWKGKSF